MTGPIRSAVAGPPEDAAEIRVLGAIRVLLAGTPADLGDAKHRLLLAMLVAAEGRLVTTEQLIDQIWDGHPPEKAREQIHSYIYELRRCFDRGLQGAAAMLPRYHDGGYRLRVSRDRVDLSRFRDLCSRAYSLRRTNDAEAVDLLQQALSLWKGGTPGAQVVRPLADLSGTPAADCNWLEAYRQALLEEHYAALIARLEAQLRLGEHERIIAELAGLVAAGLPDERIAGLLMVALYRNGRQADATLTYQSIRSRLSEEAGMEPGPDLRQLHHRILTHDPGLDLPRRESSADAADQSQPAQAGPRRAGDAPPAATVMPGLKPGPPVSSGSAVPRLPAANSGRLRQQTGPVNLGYPPGPARDLADVFRRLRESSSLGVGQIARRSGFSSSHISEVLRGLKAPSPAAAVRIAQVMGADENTVIRARRYAENWEQHRREAARDKSAAHAITTGATPRLPVHHQLRSPDVSITILEGDLFDQDTHIAVGFSDTFDTSTAGNRIISDASLQGQLLQRRFGGDQAAFDEQLMVALASVKPAAIENRCDKPYGKLQRYPLGTVAVLGAPRRLVFAVAYGRMSNELIVRGTADELWHCYTKLWEAVYRQGQRGDLSVPLMGAGLARVDTLDRGNLLQLILLSFTAYSRLHIICRNLRIVLYSDDIGRIDPGGLQTFLRSL